MSMLSLLEVVVEFEDPMSMAASASASSSSPWREKKLEACMISAAVSRQTNGIRQDGYEKGKERWIFDDLCVCSRSLSFRGSGVDSSLV